LVIKEKIERRVRKEESYEFVRREVLSGLGA
jgi:hypothetical protein